MTKYLLTFLILVSAPLISFAETLRFSNGDIYSIRFLEEIETTKERYANCGQNYYIRNYKITPTSGKYFLFEDKHFSCRGWDVATEIFTKITNNFIGEESFVYEKTTSSSGKVTKKYKIRKFKYVMNLIISPERQVITYFIDKEYID